MDKKEYYREYYRQNGERMRYLMKARRSTDDFRRQNREYMKTYRLNKKVS